MRAERALDSLIRISLLQSIIGEGILLLMQFVRIELELKFTTRFYRIAIITKDGIERRTHLHNELPKFENFMH